MLKEIFVIRDTARQTATGLIFFTILIFIFRIIVFLYESFFNTKLIADVNVLNLLLAIIATMGTALYIYNSNKTEKESDEVRKQIDLLIVLEEELDFLKGNLESYKKSFSKEDHYPLYELWEIDTSLYFSNLSHKINRKETLKLKKNLMKIKDKIIVINNFKHEFIKIKERRSPEHILNQAGAPKIIVDNIIKTIDQDIIPVVEESKKIVENIKKPI